MTASSCNPGQSAAGWLNRHCRCIALDRAQLARDLDPTGALPASMFADHPVFVTPEEKASMQRCIDAVEAVAALPGYSERVLASAPRIAHLDSGTRGLLLGYDFHLTTAGARLIEINTNAGGALLCLGSARSLVSDCDACTRLIEPTHPLAGLEERLAAIFVSEWRAAGRAGLPRRIAIVDESPREQYLHPEFLLYQQLLERAGISALIAAPEELEVAPGALLHRGLPIDLVYNRLTDFYLKSPAARALAVALEQGSAVVTPDPRAHALYARKSNLALLTDAAALAELGVPAALSDVLLDTIPRTVLVEPAAADALWAERKRYYFKPIEGFGSRATYAGRKLTRSTWAAIVAGGYVAQDAIEPSRRAVTAGEDDAASMKLDVRHYTYGGATQLVAARLYRGQTTNFRTPGGGFAPVLLSPAAAALPAAAPPAQLSA